eukprot:6190644-Pleurochrysis_carterae.AAC.5
MGDTAACTVWMRREGAEHGRERRPLLEGLRGSPVRGELSFARRCRQSRISGSSTRARRRRASQARMCATRYFLAIPLLAAQAGSAASATAFCARQGVNAVHPWIGPGMLGIA